MVFYYRTDKVRHKEIFSQADGESDAAERNRNENIKEHQKAGWCGKPSDGFKSAAKLIKNTARTVGKDIVAEIDLRENLDDNITDDDGKPEKKDQRRPPGEQKTGIGGSESGMG